MPPNTRRPSESHAPRTPLRTRTRIRVRSRARACTHAYAYVYAPVRTRTFFACASSDETAVIAEKSFHELLDETDDSS